MDTVIEHTVSRKTFFALLLLKTGKPWKAVHLCSDHPSTSILTKHQAGPCWAQLKPIEIMQTRIKQKETNFV
jgi:hypothetical protein